MNKKVVETGRFDDLGIRDKLLDILKKKGFETPTPIQHQVIPGALKGKDVIGIAQTGTGKTLAFGIPMIQNIALNKGQGLVLVPTRELAEQVDQALRQVGSGLGLRTAVVIGGVSQHRQVQALRKKPHVVIATPGRLDDLMKQGLYSLKKLTVIALDEADRMLDVGFLPQIKQILRDAPKDKQTLLFSATMPGSISGLASEFMKLPLRIEVAPQGTSAKNVEQEVFVVSKDDKMKLLESILKEYETNTTLIFSRTKHGAKKIARKVREMGFTSTEIHSNRSQAQRKAALAGFTKGKFRVMVATDIAARGIDVKSISLVINFDLPENSEDYVHRIGRTGRAGRSGKAISFVTTSQKANVRKIEKLIRKSLPLLSHPAVPQEKGALRNDSRSGGGGGRSSSKPRNRSTRRRTARRSGVNGRRKKSSQGGGERKGNQSRRSNARRSR